MGRAGRTGSWWARGRQQLPGGPRRGSLRPATQHTPSTKLLVLSPSDAHTSHRVFFGDCLCTLFGRTSEDRVQSTEAAGRRVLQGPRPDTGHLRPNTAAANDQADTPESLLRIREPHSPFKT